MLWLMTYSYPLGVEGWLAATPGTHRGRPNLSRMRGEVNQLASREKQMGRREPAQPSIP